MEGSALIHFDGPWTDRERERVMEVAKEFEILWPSHTLKTESTWVMIRSDAEPKRTYLASHVHLEAVFNGESAEGLVSQIRAIAP